MAQDGPWHTWRNPGAGPKTEKCNFPVRGVPKRKKNVTTLSGMVVRNFFTLPVLHHRALRGRNSQNTSIFGHFGLGRPLALREIPGLGRKRKNTISRSQAHFWGKIPQKFIPESAQPFYILRFGRPDLHRREIATPTPHLTTLTLCLTLTVCG